MSQGKKPTVLLVEADASLRRLIVLGLQHRDMNVVEASTLSQVSGVSNVDLLIVDVDSGVHRDWSLLKEIQATLLLKAVPTIVLAWEQLSLASNSAVATQTQTICLAKPFDARVMQESISQLLTANEAHEAALLAQAEVALLATYKTRTPASIWPIITAIGLLIAFTGMLLQVAVTILGVLIIIIALLWWTLGAKSPQSSVALS